MSWCSTLDVPEWRYNPNEWASWYDDGYQWRRAYGVERRSWYEMATERGFAAMDALWPGENG